MYDNGSKIRYCVTVKKKNQFGAWIKSSFIESQNQKHQNWADVDRMSCLYNLASFVSQKKLIIYLDFKSQLFFMRISRNFENDLISGYSFINQFENLHLVNTFFNSFFKRKREIYKRKAVSFERGKNWLNNRTCATRCCQLGQASKHERKETYLVYQYYEKRHRKNYFLGRCMWHVKNGVQILFLDLVKISTKIKTIIYITSLQNDTYFNFILLYQPSWEK